MQRLWSGDLLVEHWRCIIKHVSGLRIWDLLADNRGHISQHMLGVPDALALAGSEQGRHRLRLQRGRNGQQRRPVLAVCRGQVQSCSGECRMQRLWSGDLLVEHWRYVIIDLLRLQSRQWLVLPSWIGVSTRGRVSRRVVLHGRLKRQTSVQSERREKLP